jgi:hypothetical protein
MPRDLRKYASTTNKRLAIGAVVLLLVVGVGLIAWLYGKGAAAAGLLCLLGGLGLAGIVALFFYLIGLYLKNSNKD